HDRLRHDRTQRGREGRVPDEASPNVFAVVPGATERHMVRESSVRVRRGELADLPLGVPGDLICGPLQGHNATCDGASGGVRETTGNGYGLIDLGRALARRERDRRAGQCGWRWRRGRGRRGRNLTELGGPAHPRGSETDADITIRHPQALPGRLVLLVDHVRVCRDL